jgi:hypothetical protein
MIAWFRLEKEWLASLPGDGVGWYTRWSVCAAGEPRAPVAGKAFPGAAGDEVKAVAVAGAVEESQVSNLLETKLFVLARSGARTEEVDPVNLGLLHVVSRFDSSRLTDRVPKYK